MKKRMTSGVALAMMAIALAAALGAFALVRVLPFAAMAENWVGDFRFGAFAPSDPPSPDVVLVTITEDTLDSLPYRSPVDRGFLAELLVYLNSAGPRAIGVDILFDQPTEPAKDARMRGVLAGMKVPTIVATAERASGLTENQVAHLSSYLNGVRTGLANLIREPTDGTVRWIFGGRIRNGKRSPGFVPAVAAAAGLDPPETDIPLAYRTPPADGKPIFPTYPAHTVRVMPKAWFAGKVVLIGADLPLIDRHRTPFAAYHGDTKGSLPGVNIHAHALAQLIEGRKPSRVGEGLKFALLIVVAGLGVASARIDLPLVSRSGLLGTAVAGYWVAALVFFVPLPMVAPSLAFLAAAGGGNAYLGRRARHQKRFIVPRQHL
jgi:CHASE2 domain-containing sensor protein